jgi:hypothetical protein
LNPGFPVWGDLDSITPGENWASQVGKALESCDVMLCIISPNWVKSEYGQRELEYALGNPRFKGRLIPIVAKPTPANQIPWILRSNHVLKLKAKTADAAGRELTKLLRSAASESSN